MTRSSASIPPSDHARVGLWPTLRLLGQVVWQASPALLLSLILLSILTGVIPPLTLLVNSALLNLIVERLIASPQQQQSWALTPPALRLLLALGLLLIAGQGVSQLQQFVQRIYQDHVVQLLQLRLATHASQLDLAFFENPAFHNQLTHALNEASFRPVSIVTELLTIGSSLVTVGWVVLLVWQWQWWIVPLVIAITCIRYWLAAREGKVHASQALIQTPLQRAGLYLSMVLTQDLFAKEVRLFDLSAWLLAHYRRTLDTYYQQRRQSEQRLLLLALGMQPALMVYRLLLVGYALLLALQRVITVGQFSLYTQSLGQLDTGCTTIITQGAQLYENLLFFRNLVTFLQIAPDVERPRPTSQLTSEIPVVVPRVHAEAPSIDFCDVSFRYPDAPMPVLDHLTFHLAPGEIVALVGMNGAGKTTIVKLLAGLYQPTSGKILLNGHDISTLDRRVLRAWLSVIFQDYSVYHLSVAENIGVGQVSAIDDRERIERAAERSGLASVVQQFPERYEAILGRFIERGYELSGGQRQLLALARALMKEAPVLILDEPAAALDVEREQAFFEQLFEMQQQRQSTILFISHRYSTVRHADHILFLEGGRVLEEGSHEDLMRNDGRYAQLFTGQVRMFHREQQESCFSGEQTTGSSDGMVEEADAESPPSAAARQNITQ